MKVPFTFPIAKWDEGIPIGNGLLGGVVWGGPDEIIVSLDQATLWDERTPAAYRREDWCFAEMERMILSKKWRQLTERFESPAKDPWPTKIRACRLILGLPGGDEWTRGVLDIASGCIQLFSGKGRVEVVCDASRPLLALRARGLWLRHRLEFPDYRRRAGEKVAANSLRALDYPAATHGRREKIDFCVQKVAGGTATVTATLFQRTREGCQLYTYVSGLGDPEEMIEEACEVVGACADNSGVAGIQSESGRWWKRFWAASRAEISHKGINRHYLLAQYFLGSCSRAGAPPMPLQGVWTADEKTLPAWRGDYHHNLNTQFSYISYLANNRVEQGLAFLDHMWKVLPKHRELAARFFKSPGAFVPGAMSLAGEAISGWAPYAFSLTNGSWVAEMFHRHWKHTLDVTFLRERAYPYCLAQAELLLHLLRPERPTGRLVLPMSTSAEIYDNTPRSYLPANSNYDHFLILKLFRNLQEMSAVLGRSQESRKWRRYCRALGTCATAAVPSPDGLIRGPALSIAPGVPLDRSHRHHAHLMGIYPLNMLHPANGRQERDLIDNTLRQIDLLGTGEWVGYSFSWYAGLCARIGHGSAAVSMLERYLDGFVSPNGFHLNGDFKNLGYSVYKYRPFTLEGNFAAAQAVNEMLLRTVNGVIRIGSSLPGGVSASFDRLRTENGFLVSAEVDSEGKSAGIVIQSTVGGLCRVANPWPEKSVEVKSSRSIRSKGCVLEVETVAGEDYRLTPI